MGQSIAVVNDFQENLTRTHGPQRAEWWDRFYHATFPSLLSISRIEPDGPLQRRGIDCTLKLAGGMTVTVDEKDRWKRYDDILLERWSDFDKQTPGWSIDPHKTCDYIAYVIHPLKKSYMFPFALLRTAFTTHWRLWREEYEHKTGKEYAISYSKEGSRSWRTANIPVSWGTLGRAMFPTDRFYLKAGRT